MEDTTSGAKAAEATVSQDTVDASQNCQKTGKRPTRKTARLTPEQTLEILQQSFILCEQAGIVLAVGSAINGNGTTITLESVRFDNGNLRLSAITGTPEQQVTA